MKKTISILLSIIIAFSSLSVGFAAYAEECEHSYFTVKTVAPTCANDGYTQRTCKKCNHTIHTDITPATGAHNYINGICKNCSAKDENYKIEPTQVSLDETVTLSTTKAGEYVYASFVPDEDGYYDVRGINATVYMCEITDTVTNKNLAYNIYFNSESYSTALLTKGTEYLIKVYFGNGNAIGDISFVIKNHLHNFKLTKGTSTCSKESTNTYRCSGCGYNYTDTNPIDPNKHYLSFEGGPVCKWCNNTATVKQAVENEENVLPATSSDTYIYYSFVPESDGQYAVFTTCGSAIFLPYIMDEDHNILNDRLYQQKKGYSGHPSHFSAGIVYDKFEAGKTYYIGIYCKDKIADEQNTFTIKKHEHNIYLYSNVAETCNREGYKIYKCSTCEYTEKTEIVPPTNNHDYLNGKCRICSMKNPDEIKSATFTPEQSATLTSKYQKEELIFNFTADADGYYEITSTVEPGENSIRLSANGSLLNSKSFHHINAGESIKIICLCYAADTQVTLTAAKHEHKYYVTQYTPQGCMANGSITYRCSICTNQYSEKIPYEQDVHHYFNGACRCGKKDSEYQRINGALALDSKITLKEELANTKFTYAFNADEDGFYTFSGRVEDDYYQSTLLNVYDESNEIIDGRSSGSRSLEVIVEMEKGETVYVEWASGSSGTSSLIVQRHIHKTSDKVIAPKCNELGYTEHVCTNSKCGYVYYDTFTPATGEHIFVETVHKPTCIEPGYTETICKNCGIGYTYDYVSPGNEYHKFKNSFCEYCDALNCDAEIVNVGLNEKLELSFSSINDIKILSFTPSKTEMYTISPKINTVNVMLYANDLNTYLYNSPSSLTTLLEANVKYLIVLQETGTYTKKVNFDITEHNHRYTEQKVNATCGDYGYVEYYCAVCESSRFVNYTEPTGKHRWVKDEVVKPTCTDEGYTSYYCKTCYEQKKEDIVPATNEHRYKNGFCIYCNHRERDNKIDLGELIEGKATTVEYSDADAYYSLTFKPTESTTYLFKSTGTIDTYAKLLDSNGNVLTEDDDNALAYNFQIVCNLKQDEAYTLIIEKLDYDKKAFDVTVERHTHDFAEINIPGNCGNDSVAIKTCKTCFEIYEDTYAPATNEHKYNEFGICTECMQFKDNGSVPTIEPYKENKVEKYTEGCFKFVADTDGEYTVCSRGDLAPIAIFADEKGNAIEQKIDRANGFNISVTAKLKAGLTYYIFSTAEIDEYSLVLIAKHEHKYEIISEPMVECYKQGYTVYQCSICNEKKEELTNGALHEYYNVVYAPTCTSKGYTHSECIFCGYTYNHDFKAQLQHNFYVLNTLPSCNEKGYKTRYCLNCDYECRYDYKNPAGHRWSDNYTVTKKATYASTGVRVRTCCDCGAKKNEVIPKLKVAKAKSVFVYKRSRGFKVSWKRNSSATGYQVQYSTSSKFKKAKTITIKSNKTLSRVVSGLKGKKKYYVRVRCYKTYKNKKYYSSWSKAKAVTTKR